MGVLLKWRSIDSEATYTTARVYRASSREGQYSQIASQAIGDQSYYDSDGTTNSWYKVDFYDSSTDKSSALSDPIKGGTFKGYCTVDDVRTITNLTANDISDTKLCLLIEYAGAQLNGDINVYHEEEQLSYINSVKNNEIDSSNTTFYTKNYPIGDSDNDMDVDTDDIEVWTYDGDGESRTEVTVSSIVPNEGKFVLSNAPSASLNKVTVTYRNSPLSVSDPHFLIKSACALLAAAWAYTKINVGKAPRWRMGSTQIWRDMDSFKTYYDKYLKILNQINNRSLSDAVEAAYLI